MAPTLSRLTAGAVPRPKKGKNRTPCGAAKGLFMFAKEKDADGHDKDPPDSFYAERVAQYPGKTPAELCQTIELRHRISMVPPERRALLVRAIEASAAGATPSTNISNGVQPRRCESRVTAVETPPLADDHKIDHTDADLAAYDEEPEPEIIDVPSLADELDRRWSGAHDTDTDDEHSSDGAYNGALPDALRPLVGKFRWVLWKWETRENGKRTKVPYQPSGKKAESDNPRTWTSFAAACAARERFDGIGFCLFDSGIAAFDIDNCRKLETGEIYAWARDLVQRVGSYAEITVSGTGLRIIGYGNGSKVHRKLPVADGVSCEIYRQAERYIVMTGDALLGANELKNIDQHIDATLAELEQKKASAPTVQSASNTLDMLPANIASLLHVAGSGEYQSRSELLFAFITGALHKKVAAKVIGDACLNDAFRGGGIYEHCRENGGQQYVERQIAKAGRGHESASRASSNETPIITCVADVPAREIEWLWPGRFALGKFGLIGGHPGLGKSQITCAIAAAITNGGPWPNNEGHATQGSVLMLSAEDDVADTIRPRLEAAGADVSRVHMLEAVRTNEGGRRGLDLSRDIAQLEKALAQVPDTQAIIIDPLSAYMGKIDSHRATDVRFGVLAPLQDLAQRARVRHRRNTPDQKRRHGSAGAFY
jgi:hypothetical protein